MKKWLQNLSGAVMASLLAITLNGKAYAEDPQPVPAETQTEVVETAPEPAPAPVAPVPAPEPVAPVASAIVEAPPSVAQAAPVVAAPAPAPAPAPAAEAAPVASAAPTAMAAAVPVAVEAAAAPAPASAASEASAASSEAPVAAPKAAEPAAEETAIVEAPDVLQTPVAADIFSEKTPAAVSEALIAADVTPVIEEQAEVKSAVDGTIVEIQAVEKEKTVELEEPAVKEKAQQAVDETVLEDNKEPLQEINAKNASSDNSEKRTSPKKLSLTKDGPSSDGESGAAANLLSVQEDSEKTGSLEEKDGKELEEHLDETANNITRAEESAKRGAGVEEPVRGGNEDPAETSAPENNPIRVMDDGSYVMVNHSGTENLRAEGDISILAAGLNRITSISGTGKVCITGTGILLVDSLNGELELQTFEDIYRDKDGNVMKGSVAVFVKQKDNKYELVNGTVPGLLDEEYKIEGVTLVMPDQTSLRLLGTGAQPIMDETGNVTSVQYYHGNDRSCEEIDDDSERESIIESSGILTIARNAELIVKKGAKILLENLNSLKTPMNEVLYPEINVTDGGKLTVEGSIEGGGIVEFDTSASALSGGGSVKASRIIFNSPTAVSGSDVRLSSREIMLKGSGTINGLKIHSSTVYVESNSIIITDLDSTGGKDEYPEFDGEKSVIVLPDSSTLGIKNVEGELHLRQRRYYQSFDVNHLEEITDEKLLGASDYDDQFAQTITGTIGGSGEIWFGSGIYQLREISKGDGVSFSSKGGGLVYDYAGVLSTSQSPLQMQPSYASSAAEKEGKIPIVAAVLEEHNDVLTADTLDVFQDLRAGVKIIIFGESVELKDSDGKTISSINATRNGDNWVLPLESLKAILQQNMMKQESASLSPYPIVVEFLHKIVVEDTVTGTTSTILSTSFCSPDSLNGDLNVNDVCLIRVSYVKNEETISPGGTATQTGLIYTGSGILGGSGAGSVYTEDPGQGDGSGNDSGDNTDNNNVTPPEPVPVPEPDNNAKETELKPEPVPLVGYVEDIPEAVPLVWVELAPTMNDATVSPTEMQYVVLALEGEKTLEELGGKATVAMNYTPPEEYAGKPLYVVFRDENNKLVAFRATYSNITGLLRFITDRQGSFMIVGLDFDVTDIPEGEDFPPEFYEALAKLPELKNLVYTEVGVI